MGERASAPEAEREESLFSHADSTSAASQSQAPKKLFALYSPLIPSMLGLALARSGLIVQSYGSYVRTDSNIYTDGSTLVALLLFGVLLFALATSKQRLSKHAVNVIMRACIVVEALCLLCSGFETQLQALAGDFDVRFCLSILCFSSGSGAIFYWLRRARGSSTTTAALYVFCSLAVSEVLIYLCALAPPVVSNLAAMVGVLCQFPLMLMARSRTQSFNIESPTQANDYFGFTKDLITSKHFLGATAIGIGFLAAVVGFLRGYPDGDAIAFMPATRLTYGALTCVISVSIVVMVLRGRQRIMTVGIFMLMQALACLALLAYAAFPDMLDIGAVFTTTLNALMVGFTWYITIAFMSYGWRDPYYYALAGWLVWLGARAIARVSLLAFYPLSQNDLLMHAFIGGALVLSTQVVFMQFLRVGSAERKRDAQGAQDVADSGALTRLMGLDQGGSQSDMRHASMERNVTEMGRQYLLSDREVEVLTLYALGFTQKRVAEELFISQGTVHAHIKRIYVKTGLHSRQEILDYLAQYAS